MFVEGICKKLMGVILILKEFCECSHKFSTSLYKFYQPALQHQEAREATSFL